MVSLNRGKQRRLRFLTLCFFSSLILLIVQTVMNVKDVNDGWILEGIWPYFLLFALSYGGIVGFSPNLKLIAIASGIYISAINLLPNAKYVFIYGYHDPLLHYASIRETTILGHAVGMGPYATQYGGTPGMHIMTSMLSTATGMDTNIAMKTFIIAAPFVIPLMIYMVATRISLPLGLAKATIASVAIIFPVTYTYYGASVIYPVYVLFVYSFLLVAILEGSSRSRVAITILLGVTILGSHDVTSLVLLVYMLSFLFATRTPAKLRDMVSVHLSLPLMLLFVVMIAGHFLFSSLENFARFLSLGSELLSKLLLGQGPAALSQYEALYTLSRLDIIRVFLARYGKDIFSILLISLAPLAYLKLPLSRKSRVFYKSLVLPIFFAATMFIGLLFLRPAVHREFYIYSFLPFLGGLSVYYLFYLKPRFKKTLILLSICAFAALSCLATYPLQPLIPTVSTMQSTYYVYDMRAVNTIYDRSLISFVSTHNDRLLVWADGIMVTEIYGLTSLSFLSLLEGNPNKSHILLISHTEHAHAIPSGRNALANEMYLQQCMQNASILYNNGFSYAFLNASTITGRNQR